MDSTRAPRFALQLPMKYRPVGDARWRDGTTENISRSGVLFRAPDMLEPNTAIEMRVALPVGSTPERFSEIHCSGRIVRTVGATTGQWHPGLAAAITDYRLKPPEEPPRH